MNISTICPDCGKDMSDNLSGHPFSDCRIQYIFRNAVPEKQTIKNMSIKIEFEAANGADLRKEMLDLLGISGTAATVIERADVLMKPNLDFVFPEEVQENMKKAQELDAKLNAVAAQEEAPKPEQTTRKRRTKAEIEAEAALTANTGTEEPPAAAENTKAVSEDDGITPILDDEKTDVVPAVTAEDLTKKCVELGRAGKRDAVLGVFESQFGGATISKKDGKPQLTADQYSAVMDALNAL